MNTRSNKSFSFSLRKILFGFVAILFTFTLIMALFVIRHARASTQRNPQSPDAVWQFVAEATIPANGQRQIVPQTYRTAQVNEDALRPLLGKAPLEFSREAETNPITLALPMPDGTFSRFRIEESPIMEAPLPARYPEIKTYRGQGMDDLTATVRFDLTPAGFHAMILSEHGTVYIDPYAKGDTQHYLVYYKRDYRNEAKPFQCYVEADRKVSQGSKQVVPNVANGTILRTYRLALAATGEYTTYHGGTVLGALSAMNTTMNRINGVFTREVAVRLMLIGNDDTIVYTNAATDPYDINAPHAFSDLLDQNKVNLNQVIGTANYDIGHVFTVYSSPTSLGGSGRAVRGVCVADEKARAATGFPNPVGEAFDIDYVAHEMGHQFGANHTFNGMMGTCGGNQAPDVAYEPGSGSTIMAYAGNCIDQNLQPHSDDYFHVKNLEEMATYVAGTMCDVETSTGNSLPTVYAGPTVTIPKSTPFMLAATASDANGDALTYCWEEYDLGTQSPPDTDADGNPRPIFRSFNPASNSSRTFPKLQYILNNANVPPSTYNCSSGACLTGEVLPAISRTMNFQVTVRDNRAGCGGINTTTKQVIVSAGAGPFLVTGPNTSVMWSGGTQQTVTWNVAGTSVAPVSTSNVKISLSTDGGNTFPTALSANTLNDGTQTITVPNTPTMMARIKVEAIGNIFFDISDVNFTIMSSGPTNAGDLDPTFNGTGKVIGFSGSANAVALQADGKIIAAGETYINGSTDFALVRYNTDGSLDSAFGSGGIVTTPIGSTDIANAVAVQTDGKIVAAGKSYLGSDYVFALARYNPNGSLDNSFGSGGKVTTAIGNVASEANAVALQADGKIIATGLAWSNGYTDFALARFGTNGVLDNTFSGDGKLTTDFGGGIGHDEAFAVAVQADSKIVVAGSTFLGDFGLARYNTNGSLDSSFGSGGKVTTDFAGWSDVPHGVALQANGRIVVAGSSDTQTDDFFGLARYNSNGTMDSSFGSGGKVTTDIGHAESGRAVAIQADGKIVVAGYTDINLTPGNDFGLARYNPNGSLDMTFGSSGKVITDFGNSWDAAFAVAVQADGKIIAAGTALSGVFALARYLGDAVSPAMQFGATNYGIDEGSSTIYVKVTRVGDTSGPASVSYATSDGTATDGSDYVATAGTLNFASGECCKYIPVSIISDSISESNETFNVTLSNASGTPLGSTTTTTVTILDDEVPLVVTNTGNSGAGSLRQAIVDANATMAQDAIAFNIPGSGPFTITPSAALPPITNPVVIDGTTQPGYAGTPIIELNGTSAGANSSGLTITTANCTVKGLVINRFGGSGILLSGVGATGNKIQGNYIGTNVAGTAALSNTGEGIKLLGASNNTIGGAAAGAGNVISGNTLYGVFIVNNANFNQVKGNLIGTNASGAAALGNAADGVIIQDSTNNTVGGSTLGERNVISANQLGVRLIFSNATNNLIAGNFIGTDVTGTVALGNTTHGVVVTGSASSNAIRDNYAIAHNGGNGITVLSGTENLILRNSIFSNGALGIDLNGDGVTPNDAGDGDTGPNNLQNFPVLTSAVTNGASINIQGTLNSTSNATFLLNFFASPSCDGSGNGEGKTYLGALQVTTDGNGNATINSALNASVSAGQVITATAMTVNGSSSEFSACRVVASSCIFSLGSTNLNFTADGGNGNISITANDAACSWTAASNAAWITVNTPSGSGSGNVNYTVQANSSMARTGTMTIAGQTFTVSQDAPIIPVEPGRPDIDWMRGGHYSDVADVACSPDGQTIATAGADRTIKLFRTSDGTLRRTLAASSTPFSDIAYSPDGTKIASCATIAGGREIKLWNVSDGTLIKTIASGLYGPNIAFCPTNSNLLAIGGWDAGNSTDATLWDLSGNPTSGTLIRSFSQSSRFGDYPFSPDGLFFASYDRRDGGSGCGGQRPNLYNVSTGAFVKQFDSGFGGVPQSISPNGQYLAATNGAGVVVYNLNVSTGSSCSSPNPYTLVTTAQVFLAGGFAGTDAIFSPDGQYLAVGARVSISGVATAVLKIYQVSNWSLINSVSFDQTDALPTITFSQDSQKIAAGARVINLFSPAGTLSQTISDQIDVVSSVAFSANGQFVASCNLASSSANLTSPLNVWNAATGNRLFTLDTGDGASGGVQSVAISADSSLVATASVSSTNGIKLWNASTGVSAGAINSPAEQIIFSPDGQNLFALRKAGSSPFVKEFRISDGMLLRAFATNSDGMALSPDGNKLAIVEAGLMVKLYDATTGSLQNSFGISIQPRAMAFSPDGLTLLIGGDGSLLSLFRVSDGVVLQTFTGHGPRWVEAVAFAPNGQTCASSGEDGTVRIWRVADGTLLRSYSKETGSGEQGFAFAHVQSLAYSPDGAKLFYGRGDATVVMANAPCGSYSLFPTSSFFGVTGAEGSVDVVASSGCSWTATTNEAWITITSDSTGSGNGTITYVVRDNFEPSPRQGTINVAGQVFTITQDSITSEDCSYEISPQFSSLPATGGSSSFLMIAEERCAWYAQSSDGWITVTPGSGIGGATISYTVAANPGTAGRAGTITVGGKSFRIKQKGQ